LHWDVAVDRDTYLPEWFPVLLETLGGKRLNEQGTFADSEHGLFKVRNQLLALKPNDFWSRFGRWYVTPGSERTVSPNSTVTIQEWEDNQREAALR